MNAIKNVIIINDFNYVQGGASKVAIDTANLIVNQFEHVYFFSGSSEKSNVLDKKIIEVYTKQGEALKYKNKFKGFVNGLYNRKSKNILKKLLLDLDPNETIIHIHGWTKCLSSSIFSICFKKNFKVVLTLHDYFTACPNGGFYNYKSKSICKLKPMSYKCCKCNCDSRNYFFKIYRIIRQFIQNKIVKLPKRIKYLIAISKVNEDILKDYFNKNVIIKRIYNPFDSSNKIDVDSMKNDKYLYIGRASKEKGVDIFCEAVTSADVKGIVVGDGPELEWLKEKYPNIEFTGWINYSAMEKYYKIAKAVIIPSRWYEGASLIPMEASKYNIPCITASHCAAKEFVPNENVYNSFEDLVDMIKNNKFNHKVLDFDNNYSTCVINYYLDIFKGVYDE